MPLITEPLIYQNKIIIVEAIIEGPLQLHKVTLGLDTGYSMTCIRPGYLETAGFDFSKLPSVTITTGSTKGVEKGVDVPLSSFQFMGKTLPRLRVCAMRLPAALYYLDGLLGNDFFLVSRTTHTLDFKNRLISLSY